MLFRSVGTVEGDLAVKVLDEYVKDFQKRNPTLRVFGCYLHQDEATPHLHIDFISLLALSMIGCSTFRRSSRLFSSFSASSALCSASCFSLIACSLSSFKIWISALNSAICAVSSSFSAVRYSFSCSNFCTSFFRSFS